MPDLSSQSPFAFVVPFQVLRFVLAGRRKHLRELQKRYLELVSELTSQHIEIPPRPIASTPRLESPAGSPEVDSELHTRRPLVVNGPEASSATGAGVGNTLRKVIFLCS